MKLQNEATGDNFHYIASKDIWQHIAKNLSLFYIQTFSAFLHYTKLLVLNHIFHLFSQPSKDGKNLIKKPPLAPLIKWARLLIIINAPLTTWFFSYFFFHTAENGTWREKRLLSELLGSFTTLRPRSSMNTDLSKNKQIYLGQKNSLWCYSSW